MKREAEVQTRRAPTSAVYGGRKEPSRRRGVRKSTVYYLFILPASIPFVVFVLIPFVHTFALTLQSGTLLGSKTFVGFRNFLAVANDGLFWTSLLNTVKYVAMGNVSVMSISLVLALLLKQIVRFRGLIQSVLFITYLVPVTVVAVMWMFLLYPEYGVVNYLIGLVGIPAQTWLGDPKIALPTLVMIDVWRGVGFYALIWYSSVIGIPADLYEVARLEGANALQKFFRITMPMLRPTTMFLVVMSMIWAFQVFDSVWVLTGGGPSKATVTSVFYIYRQSFRGGDIGYAASMSVTLLLIVFTLTMLVYRFLKSTLEY